MKKEKIFQRTLALTLAAFFMMATVSSCANFSQNNSYQEEDNVNPDFPIHEEYVFDAQISRTDPVYLFEVSRDRNETYGKYTIRIYNTAVKSKDKEDRLVQSFDFRAAAKEDYWPISLDDMDFDGNLDLVIRTDLLADNVGSIEVYLWSDNPVTGYSGFSPLPAWNFLSDKYEIISNTRQIITWTSYYDDFVLYQLETVSGLPQRYLRLLRKTALFFSEDDNQSHIGVKEFINGEWVMIYDVPYAGEGMSDEQSALIRNYLSFGIAEPVSTKEAKAAVIEKYGDVYVTMKQMLTINGKTYYHMNWQNKNNSKQNGDCGVAVDGSELIDCKSYLKEIELRG